MLCVCGGGESAAVEEDKEMKVRMKKRKKLNESKGRNKQQKL